MGSTLEVTVQVNDGPPVGGELVVEREVQYVESLHQVKPDMRWQFVDAEGHWHAFSLDRDEQLPTLTWKTIPVPCDGSCGGVCEGEGTTRTEYRCRICDEVIEPGWVPDPGPHSIGGLWNWRLVVQCYVPLGSFVTVRVSTPGGEFFGVALPHDGIFGSLGARSELSGHGPLGRRAVAPKCTCPLIDVSESRQKPEFVRGDPKGCKAHGQARDAAIEAARAAARGDVPDPFSELARP